MKIFAIVLATFVLGCGSAPSQEKESTSSGPSEEINLPPNGSDYTGPCDRPTFSTVVVDGQQVVVEIPSLCNEMLSPDHGDPGPDRGDPNPWDKQLYGVTLKEQAVSAQMQNQH